MTRFDVARNQAERRQATRRVMRRHAVHEWWPREPHVRPGYVPAGTPVISRRERAEHLLFLVGLIGTPFVVAVLPR